MNEKELIKLAETNGTSAYIFETEKIAAQVALTREYLGTGVCYAMKANPFIVGELEGVTDRVEVCSPGEYEICMAQGVAPENLIVSGVNKTMESIRHILEQSGGKGIYTIESEKHFDILSALAKEFNVKLSVLIRLSSGNQFGVDEETWFKIADGVTADENLTLIGVHFFSGTQKKRSKIERELKYVSEFEEKLAERFAPGTLELEYGPGLAVSYFENDTDKEKQAADAKGQLAMLKELLSPFREREFFANITVEMGRFLAADCGTYITQAVDVKRMDYGNFAIVDGGIHQMTYFGQMVGMKLPKMYCLHKNGDAWTREDIAPGPQEGKESFTVCGSLCSVNDILIREMLVDDLSEGDLLVFEKCGAYSMTEGISLFLSRDLPQVFVIAKNGEIKKKRNLTEINYLNGGKQNG